MRRFGFILFFVSLIILPNKIFAADELTIDLARMFASDIFELNGVPYLNPMVESINATANSRFFNKAFVPKEVEKPYYRVSLNGMLGIVPDSKKLYTPTMPSAQLNMTELAKYGTFDLINKTAIIKDTAGLVFYAMKTIIYEGLKQGRIKTPTSTATILGSKDTVFTFDKLVIDSLVKEHFLFPLLPKAFQDTILSVVAQFPTYFTLPQGANMNTLFAGVPQIEIGSLWGTELLLRFIPPVYMGENIGDFAFWGIGLKHSISQYFENPPFDLAVQGVYQGTHLKNKVGVTNAELTALATILNLNIHASKNIYDIVDVYTGLSFEFININSTFKYYLPVEVQVQLGLLRKDPVTGQILPPEPPEYPGDTESQTVDINLQDNNFKWVIGIGKQIGSFRVYLDYNVSQFDIFTGGVEYSF